MPVWPTDCGLLWYESLAIVMIAIFCGLYHLMLSWNLEFCHTKKVSNVMFEISCGTTTNDCSDGMPSSRRRPSTTPATPSSSRGRTRDSMSRLGRSSGHRLTTSTARFGHIWVINLLCVKFVNLVQICIQRSCIQKTFLRLRDSPPMPWGDSRNLGLF